jgi:hypothetical protein
MKKYLCTNLKRGSGEWQIVEAEQPCLVVDLLLRYGYSEAKDRENIAVIPLDTILAIATDSYITQDGFTSDDKSECWIRSLTFDDQDRACISKNKPDTA